MLDLERPEWMEHGACVGKPQAWWFPGRGENTNRSKNICAACPVLDQCREYALSTGQQHGIWGGLSERERHRIRAVRNRAAGRAGCPPPSTRSAEIAAHVELLRRQGYHDYIRQTAGHFGITTSVVHKHCQAVHREQTKGAA